MAFPKSDTWDVVDLFVGAGRIARMARQSGQRSVALDLQYHPNSHCFNINEDAGMLLLSYLRFRSNTFEFAYG